MQFRLRIISTGQYLVKSKNSVLTVEIHSTLFNNQNEVKGSFSFDCEMPLEPNKAILKNAHLLTSANALRTFDVMLESMSGLAYKQCRLNYTITNNIIRANCYIDVSVLLNDLKKRKLNQLAGIGLGDAQIFSTRAAYRAYLNGTLTAEPGTMPMVFFPYKNDGAYAESAYEESPDTDLAFPIYKYINAWKITAGVGSFLLDEDYPYRHTQPPFFYLLYILKRIAGYFNLALTGEWLKEEKARRLVMWSNIAVPGYTGIPDFGYFMPDMSVLDLFKAVRSAGILIDVDLTRNILLVESLENLEATTQTVDLRPYQLDGYEELSTTLRAYAITREVDGGDNAFTEEEKAALPVLTIGDPDSAIETTDVPLGDVATKMLTEISPAEAGADNWKVPYIKQPLYNVAPFSPVVTVPYADRGKFRFRLLYWYGMQETDSGFPYPYGSADNTNSLGVPVADFTLALTNAGSAYMATKKYYEFIKNSKPIDVPFVCTAQQFFKLNPRTRVIIRDRNQATVNCLLDVAVADLQDKEQIFAKATLYPIIRPNNLAIVEGPPPVVPPVDNGLVYLRFLQTNLNDYFQSFPPPTRHIFTRDLIVEFYEDAAGIAPKAVTDLTIRYKTTAIPVAGSGSSTESTSSVVCNGTAVTVYDNAPYQIIHDSYTSNWVYEILPSGDYTIIP